jgi:hypothetical protein
MTAPETQSGIVPPEKLTVSQRECLRFCATYANVRRVARGWGLKGYATSFKNETVNALVRCKLVQKRTERFGQQRLEITGMGRWTIAIMDARIRDHQTKDKGQAA